MEVRGKFWGSTSPLFNRNNVEIHRIEGREGGFSSEHKHEAKHNMFLVESGGIGITVWKDPGGKPDYTELISGQTCVIPPGYFHKFEVLLDCVVYEIYWVDLREDDIVRRTSGGESAARR